MRTQKRYTDSRFLATQKSTLEDRKTLVDTLALPTGSEIFFEIPVKITAASHAAAPELLQVSHLSVVHFLDRNDPNIPEEVLLNTFGTILYDKKTMLRQSIPYRHDIVLDSFKPSTTPGHVTIVLPHRDAEGKILSGEKLSVNPEHLFINEFEDGTIVDIMCINGELWTTSHNLLPRGVFTPSGDKIHKKASWATHHTPYTDSLTAIFEATNPKVLESNVLFPKGTIISNRLYRFVVVTPERQRGNAGYVGPIGHAIYLGCLEQWDNEHPPLDAKLVGKPHLASDIYKFNTVTKAPADPDVPYILERKESLTIEEANKILAGDTSIKDKRFRGGGKLVVTGTVFSGGSSRAFAYHAVSPSYAHRMTMMGNDANLYRYFCDIMDLSDYTLSNTESKELLAERFAPLVLPLVGTDFTIASLEKLVNAFSRNLPAVVLEDTFDELLANHPARLLWYNFLLCTNVSIRPIVLLFLKRYVADLEFLQQWLEGLSKNKRKTSAIPDPKQKAKDDYVYKAYREIKSSPYYRNGEGFQQVLLLSGKSGKLISLARKETGTQAKSIRISEPNSKFYTKETYASICTGTSGTVC